MFSYALSPFFVRWWVLVRWVSPIECTGIHYCFGYRIDPANWIIYRIVSRGFSNCFARCLTSSSRVECGQIFSGLNQRLDYLVGIDLCLIHHNIIHNNIHVNMVYYRIIKFCSASLRFDKCLYHSFPHADNES